MNKIFVMQVVGMGDAHRQHNVMRRSRFAGRVVLIDKYSNSKSHVLGYVADQPVNSRATLFVTTQLEQVINSGTLRRTIEFALLERTEFIVANTLGSCLCQ